MNFLMNQLTLLGFAKKITGLPTISVGSVGLNKDFTKTFGEIIRLRQQISALYMKN